MQTPIGAARQIPAFSSWGAFAGPACSTAGPAARVPDEFDDIGAGASAAARA